MPRTDEKHKYVGCNKELIVFHLTWHIGTLIDHSLLSSFDAAGPGENQLDVPGNGCVIPQLFMVMTGDGGWHGFTNMTFVFLMIWWPECGGPIQIPAWTLSGYVHLPDRSTIVKYETIPPKLSSQKYSSNFIAQSSASIPSFTIDHHHLWRNHSRTIHHLSEESPSSHKKNHHWSLLNHHWSPLNSIKSPLIPIQFH